MSLDDIIKRNQRANKRGIGVGGTIGHLISNELSDPSADSTDIKNRIMAMVIVGGLVIGIIVLAMIL
jgi:hypothetical protein